MLRPASIVAELCFKSGLQQLVLRFLSEEVTNLITASLDLGHGSPLKSAFSPSLSRKTSLRSPLNYRYAMSLQHQDCILNVDVTIAKAMVVFGKVRRHP